MNVDNGAVGNPSFDLGDCFRRVGFASPGRGLKAKTFCGFGDFLLRGFGVSPTFPRSLPFCSGGFSPYVMPVSSNMLFRSYPLQIVSMVVLFVSIKVMNLANFFRFVNPAKGLEYASCSSFWG